MVGMRLAIHAPNLRLSLLPTILSERMSPTRAPHTALAVQAVVSSTSASARLISRR